MKTVICFGCGELGKYFAETYGDYIEIRYFLDNQSTDERTFWGYDRFIPSKKKCDHGFIIVTNIKYYQEISTQLNSYGLEENQDFISIEEFEKNIRQSEQNLER